jgi:hypothetical protein
MYQVITSSIVDAPPSNYILKMLHNEKALYIPQNGHRSSSSTSDTKEDMMEIFQTDVNGAPRELRRLMGRRNYAACVLYDPDLVGIPYTPPTADQWSGKMSLAVDFMVQGDGPYAAPVKYGPVIIPKLEYGQ